MKLSLMTFSLMREGIKKIIDADILCRIIREAGYEEADILESEFALYGRKELLDALKRHGVRLGCLITELPFFTAPETVGKLAASALDLAREAGCAWLMVVPGGTGPDDRKACAAMTREELLSRTAECFRKVCSLAGPLGIRVVFENTPHDFKPLSSAKDVKAVLDGVPGLGLVFDTGNFRVADTHADELEAYELLKDRIARIHLKDVRIADFPDGERCTDGRSIKAVLSGSGVIPLCELICRSLADGYSQSYAVEYAAPSDTHGIAHRDTAAIYLKQLQNMEAGTFEQCPKGSIPGIEKPVSRIFFGTAIRPVMMRANASILLDLAAAWGINAFDCARGYGEAEIALGEWVRARKNRSEVVILTKCGNVGPDGSVLVNRGVIERELNESLQRLQMDYVDIFLLHRDDPKTPVSEFIEVLNAEKRAGKIRVFGVSNWTNERIQEANAYAASKGLEGFGVSSPNYGLARQVRDPWGGGCVTIAGPENRRARAWYESTGMPVLAYSSLARGFLSGRFHSFDEAGAKRVMDSFGLKGYLSEDNMERLKQAEDLAERTGLSVPQVALQFVLASPMKVFAIAGTSGFAQLTENVRAAARPMDPEDWKRLDAI